jgi:stage IV sporulation protein FB
LFLSEPKPTAYDLRFSLFGFNVCVHPAFFILPLLIGRKLVPGDMNMGVGMVIMAGIFFVSILIHELGHTLAFRYYGIHSRIVLYWMGGLAIPDNGNAWSSSKRTGSLSSNQQIVVSFAGPAFGLLLAFATIGAVYLLGGQVEVKRNGLIPMPIPSFVGTNIPQAGTVAVICFAGIVLNIFLNLLNLVPIYPLDGGQIARQVMIKVDSFNGIRNSIILSVVCSILLALYGLSSGSQFMAIFFGFMAWSNYQSLNAYNGPRW